MALPIQITPSMLPFVIPFTSFYVLHVQSQSWHIWSYLFLQFCRLSSHLLVYVVCNRSVYDLRTWISNLWHHCIAIPFLSSFNVLTPSPACRGSFVLGHISRHNSFLKILLFFNYVPMCLPVCGYVDMCVDVCAVQKRIPWNWSYRGCESPDMGAGNQTQVLCKNSIHQLSLQL